MSLTLPPCSRVSTTPLPGLTGPSGIPEVPSSGLPSPPSSPPLAALTVANELTLAPKTTSRKRDSHGNAIRRKGGAAHAIREECERLFCETMNTVFLGERNIASNGSVAMGANIAYSPQSLVEKDGYFANRPSPSVRDVHAWLEMFDYAGGCNFRGFVSGDEETRTLFVFFPSTVVGKDLKRGLMALMELAEAVFACSQVVICLDRAIGEEDQKSLLKSLGWVGFELTTLDEWAGKLDATSDRWLYLSMEV